MTPSRRAIIVVPDEVLARLLTTEASLTLPESTTILDTHYDPVRLATLVRITGTQLDEVAPGFEAPIIPITIIEPPR